LAVRLVPSYRHPPTTRFLFDLDSMDDTRCETDFRFSKEDIRRMAQLLGFTETLVDDKYGYKARGVEVLCILLYSLSWPRRLCDMGEKFGRNRCAISRFRTIAVEIVLRWQHTLTLRPEFLARRIAVLAKCARKKGCPLPGCWGFIDGTLRPIARPVYGEEAVFSGHKRCHGLKYQSVIGTDGLFYDFQGPFDGRRHDVFLLAQSHLVDRLSSLDPDSNFYLYGDGAYHVGAHIIGPYVGATTADQKRFNVTMSRLRIGVEWGFGLVTRLWAGLDFKRTQKALQSPVASTYIAAVILTNCNTILRNGNPISQYYKCEMPSLEEYLNSS